MCVTQGQLVWYGQKSPWVPTLTELFPKIQADAGFWLGPKNFFVLLCLLSEQFLPSPFREFVHDGYCLDHGSSGSRTKEMLAVRKLSLWYKIPIWLQNTACPKTYRRLSKNKSLSLQQVFTLASVTSCVNIREFLKDATTADSHENVARKSEFTFFQSLSWLFQLAYFVKCKRTLLEPNFFQPYASSWREWILSLLVCVHRKTWN